MSDDSRSMALWVPDWPIVAARRVCGNDASLPLAVLKSGRVMACDASARSAGVRRGMRRRQAQASCPQIHVQDHDPVRDARAFLPVLAALDEVVVGAETVRPGLCLLRARGPSRYYGGEDAAARAVTDQVRRAESLLLRIGIADTPFAARQAAGQARDGQSIIVPPGQARQFLASLPVSAAVHADTAPSAQAAQQNEKMLTLFSRLGIRTLGDLAALPSSHVRERFGPAGQQVHALACAQSAERIVPDPQRRHRDAVAEFDPPLERSDQITFALRPRAEGFVARLVEDRLVCTTIRVTIVDERGQSLERLWRHPQWFAAADIADRVRWQLAGSEHGGTQLSSPVTTVRLEPVELARASDYEPTLWADPSEERVAHGLARIQGVLGHDAVVTGNVGGGRLLADRQRFTPWGERRDDSDPQAPWPGHLPPPRPARVFRSAAPVVLRDAADREPQIDGRGILSAPPIRFCAEKGPALRNVVAWAGPWPVWERWWDPAQEHDAYRLQLVDDAGQAWIVLYERGRWWAEAAYD